MTHNNLLYTVITILQKYREVLSRKKVKREKQAAWEDEEDEQGR